jgi:hypothetical protein
VGDVCEMAFMPFFLSSLARSTCVRVLLQWRLQGPAASVRACGLHLAGRWLRSDRPNSLDLESRRWLGSCRGTRAPAAPLQEDRDKVAAGEGGSVPPQVDTRGEGGRRLWRGHGQTSGSFKLNLQINTRRVGASARGEGARPSGKHGVVLRRREEEDTYK